MIFNNYGNNAFYSSAVKCLRYIQSTLEVKILPNSGEKCHHQSSLSSAEMFLHAYIRGPDNVKATEHARQNVILHVICLRNRVALTNLCSCQDRCHCVTVAMYTNPCSNRVVFAYQSRSSYWLNSNII